MKLFNVVFLSFFICSISVLGQGFKEKDWQKHLALEAQKDSIALSLALQLNDYKTATTLSYQLLVNDSKNTSKLYKLATIYFKASEFDLCVNTCASVLALDSLHKKSLLLAALSFKSVKKYDNAISTYNLLYKRFSDANYLYQIALINFETKQNEQCLRVLSNLINDTISAKQTIQISSVTAEGKTVIQDISLAAAAYNIAGFIMLNEKNFSEAKKYSTASVKKAPDFILANNNLVEVYKREVALKEGK